MKGFKVRGVDKIIGLYVLLLKGGRVVVFKVMEGMWEDKRGYKVDGGERRWVEVCFKWGVVEWKVWREV